MYIYMPLRDLDVKPSWAVSDGLMTWMWFVVRKTRAILCKGLVGDRYTPRQ